MPVTKYDIHWEHWQDAYNAEDESADNLSIEEDSGSDLGYEMLEALPQFESPIKTIMTPFGVLPLTEHSLASSHFKFWVGHTNFRLLDSYYGIIESCDGVESIDILTPYRFRIGVGKLFVDRDVMYCVKKTLLRFVKNESKKS